jgi:hypothetical protein
LKLFSCYSCSGRNETLSASSVSVFLAYFRRRWQTFAQRIFSHPEDFSNGKNPLKLLVEQLKQDFGTEGNIVTYNQSFEVARLNELANMFPEDAPFLKNLVSRVVDLLPVFQGDFVIFQ